MRSPLAAGVTPRPTPRPLSWFVVAAVVTAVCVGAALGRPAAMVDAAEAEIGYIVVFDGTAADGSFQVGGSDLLNLAAARQLLASAGARVEADLADQIGVVIVRATPTVADALAASSLVAEVAADVAWKSFPSFDEAIASGELTIRDGSKAPGGDPDETADPLEPLQWDMLQIRTAEAHAVQAGAPGVDVGVLDSGIDGSHPDFRTADGGSNVDCARGHNSVFFLPSGPGAGNPLPCVDNHFHGTHVAGTIAARANGIGVVGVAPNVTLVPVKVCDGSGFCYASAVVDGITYAGDQQLDVINMSFFVDDDAFQESTEFKCRSDETQRAIRTAVERALKYAVKRGVAPVAALGNSDQDLANPVDENGQPIADECEVVPAESDGVIGTVALGNASEKASYSNYGDGEADVSAPGGNGTTGDCTTTILSTLPGGLYGCIQGTSMASPHAAGVAALIVSQFGKVTGHGDVRLAPTRVQSLLQATAIDIGLSGYDECFGHGRIDALRAVTGDTSTLTDPSAPPCPEYSE